MTGLKALALAGAILAAAAPLSGTLGPASAAQCGSASWYAMTGRTASGERANPNAMTAAHRTLPFGSRVEVTNLRNGRSVVVRINDRGPFIRGRVIDVSKAAATHLGIVGSGTARVRLNTGGGGRCS
jgi:rare lipoprotein A